MARCEARAKEKAERKSIEGKKNVWGGKLQGKVLGERGKLNLKIKKHLER